MTKSFYILWAMAEYEDAMRAGRTPRLADEPNRRSAQMAVAITARILPAIQANGAAGMSVREAVGEALIADLGKRLASEPAESSDTETKGTGDRK